MKRVLRGRRRGATLADLLIVVGLIPLLLVAMLACNQNMRGESANRVTCASHLREIGTAFTLYADANRGAYPRTTYVGGEVVRPVWGTGAPSTQPFAANGPQANDVTAAVFLLLRTTDLDVEAFTCPVTDAVKWDFGGASKTAMDWSNFPGPGEIKIHLSYSFANPYPDDVARKSGYEWNSHLSAEFAVAADMNPGVIRGSSVLTVRSTSSGEEMKAGNSRNHEQDGQNVLYGDGHVEFQQNPFCGVNRDNIYARKAASTGFASSDICNSPFNADDSVLLPCDQ